MYNICRSYTYIFKNELKGLSLIIGASKAKHHEESFAEVRFHVDPQKPSKNDEKRVFEIQQM